MKVAFGLPFFVCFFGITVVLCDIVETSYAGLLRSLKFINYSYFVKTPFIKSRYYVYIVKYGYTKKRGEAYEETSFSSLNGCVSFSSSMH